MFFKCIVNSFSLPEGRKRSLGKSSGWTGVSVSMCLIDSRWQAAREPDGYGINAVDDIMKLKHVEYTFLHLGL